MKHNLQTTRTYIKKVEIGRTSGERGVLRNVEWTPRKTGGNRSPHLNQAGNETSPPDSLQTGTPNKRKTAEAVRDQLEKGVIEPASSKWASPVLFVPKRDWSFSFCVDYRRLNEFTVSDTYRLPKMEAFIYSLGDAVVFSTLNSKLRLLTDTRWRGRSRQEVLHNPHRNIPVHKDALRPAQCTGDVPNSPWQHTLRNQIANMPGIP